MNIRKGFTMLELIIVIAIVALLTSGMTATYSAFLVRNEVSTTGWKMVDAFNRARVYAMMGRLDKEWGVHFETSKFVLFEGSSYNAADPTNQLFPILSGYQFTNINLNGGGSNVIFNKISGETDEYGSVDIVSLDGSSSETIDVNKVGRINTL